MKNIINNIKDLAVSILCVILDGFHTNLPIILINILVIVFMLFSSLPSEIIVLPIIVFGLSAWQDHEKKVEKGKAMYCAKISQAVLGYYTYIKNEYRNAEDYKFEQTLNYYKDTVELFCRRIEYSNEIRHKDIHKVSIKQNDIYKPNLYSLFYEYKFQNLNIKEINETICLFGVLDALLIDISLANYLSENDIKILDFFLTKLQIRSRDGISKKIDDLKSKLFLLDENNYTTTGKKSYRSKEIIDLAEFLTKLLNSYIDCHVL